MYSADGNRRWPYRSINVSVTSLTMVQLDQGPALIVGTDAGTIIAYDQLGRRYWDGVYAEGSGQHIINVSAQPSLFRAPQPVALAILRSNSTNPSDPADIILLDSDGRRVDAAFPAGDGWEAATAPRRAGRGACVVGERMAVSQNNKPRCL